MRLLFAVLFSLIAGQAYAYDPFIQPFTISSSSVGTEIFGGFSGGAYISANGDIGIARLDDCSQLTSYYGTLPITATTAISLNSRNDASGKWCGILKSGSTPVTGGANIWAW
jgi:hypothetical protein